MSREATGWPSHSGQFSHQEVQWGSAASRFVLVISLGKSICSRNRATSIAGLLRRSEIGPSSLLHGRRSRMKGFRLLLLGPANAGATILLSSNVHQRGARKLGDDAKGTLAGRARLATVRASKNRHVIPHAVASGNRVYTERLC